MILNLDQDFKPINGEEIQFESFTFSGGELHIKINPNFNLIHSTNCFLTHYICK